MSTHSAHGILKQTGKRTMTKMPALANTWQEPNQEFHHCQDNRHQHHTIKFLFFVSRQPTKVATALICDSYQQKGLKCAFIIAKTTNQEKVGHNAHWSQWTVCMHASPSLATLKFCTFHGELSYCKILTQKNSSLCKMYHM